MAHTALRIEDRHDGTAHPRVGRACALGFTHSHWGRSSQLIVHQIHTYQSHFCREMFTEPESFLQTNYYILVFLSFYIYVIRLSCIEYYFHTATVNNYAGKKTSIAVLSLDVPYSLYYQRYIVHHNTVKLRRCCNDACHHENQFLQMFIVVICLCLWLFLFVACKCNFNCQIPTIIICSSMCIQYIRYYNSFCILFW